MPIPAFNKHGFLPEGIHICTVEEVASRFGSFQSSDRRPHLWARFRDFLREIRASGVGLAIVINGSFATSKAEPNDIDLILVVPASHDFGRDLSPGEYNILSSQQVRRRHGLDLLVASADSDQYRRYVRLFQQVRWAPAQTKGLLRINL
ncbi:MAG: hypothetical protein L0Z50_37785 [Verrucomicrobiales bacterium]|nr:hypothetical protein [Verrucomicrobiales bacterium]